MKKPSSAGRKSQVESRRAQVESRRAQVESPKSQDARRKTPGGKGTFESSNLRTFEPAPSAPSAAVALDLPVPETLLAKLRLASPSGDPAAAALSFLLDRFKQPVLESATFPHERPFPARKV